MSQSENRAVQARKLENFCLEVLMASGVPHQEAEIVSHSLVATDLRGVLSHGVISLPRYVSLIHSGAARAEAKIEIVRETGPMSVWDGCGSLGQVMGVWAMDKCLEKARENTIGIVGVKKSNHIGACASQVLQKPSETNLTFCKPALFCRRSM